MSAYCHTCYRHSLHSFILRQSSPVIIWARLAPFYWYNYTHRLGRIITSHLTSQWLYTLLRPISHVASSPRHLSHSPDLCFHIYHHSLVRFACLSAKDCRTPRTVTLRSLRSHRSHTHHTAFGFWVLLLCTALIRRLSVYHRYSVMILCGMSAPQWKDAQMAKCWLVLIPHIIVTALY